MGRPESSVLSKFHASVFRVILLACASIHSASADEPQNTILLELNKVEDAGANCRLSFVMSNLTRASIASASYELVVFSKDGIINQMSVFDFGTLPANKTVVRQFELPAITCAQSEKLLINGPAGCSGEPPAHHCSASLSLSSRTGLTLTQ